MKLFKKLKKNNHGLTLVELICAVAILGLATTAIGSAMVISAQNYQRNTIEFDVQQEAQTTTNLIGNMIVDAKEASFSSNVLTVKGEGITYEVTYDSDTKKLNYKQKDKDNKITTGVLAENVESFTVDDSAFKSSKNVKVDLQVMKNGKTYNATYNTTARNGEVSNFMEAGSFAKIEIEKNVILEPNQTYEFPLYLKGIDVTKLKDQKLQWDFSDGDSKLASYSGDNNKATITLKNTAAGAFTFTVAAVTTDDTILTSETVVVKVRRVNNIDLLPVIDGTNATAGTKYELCAVCEGDNLLMDLGANYDKDYKKPNYVDFKAEITGQPAGKSISDYIGNIQGYENQNTPQFTFTMMQDLPYGATITIKAISKHAEGMFPSDGSDAGIYNKASQSAGSKVSYPCNVAEFKIYGIPGPGDPPPGGGMEFPNGIKRGNDHIFGVDIITYFDPVTIKTTINELYGVSAEPHYYMRYRSENDSDWSAYRASHESGTTKKINADETRLFHHDLAYEIEIINVLVAGNKIYWPQDESLLNEKGFLGYEKGWTDEVFTNDTTKDLVATSFGEYGGHYDLGAAELVFYNEPSTNEDDAVNLPVGNFYKKVGSPSGPIKLSFTGADGLPKNTTMYFNVLNTEKQHYQYTPIVWKQQDDGSWGEPLEDWKFDLSKNSVNQFLTFGQNTQPADRADAKGVYRIGLIINGTYMTENGVNADGQRVLKESEATKWDINDTSGEDGFIYIEYVD